MAASPALAVAYESHNLKISDITLNIVTAGHPSGPPLLFLHGFPEFWYGWRRQIEYFSRQGFRVIVPDQRGYNSSEKPRSAKHYRLDLLAADMVHLLNALELEKTCVVGHDWGGAVAWWLGLNHADRLEKLVVLNCPHPAIMRQHLLHNPRQRRRSWYIFFFQFPFLPEWRMRRAEWDIAQRALQRTSRRGTFSDADIALYKAAWSQPGAAQGMINWYRAMFRARPKAPGSPRLHIPVLLIWGRRDRFLGEELAQPSIDLCRNGRLEYIDSATHWVQHEEPERVNQLIHEFITNQ